MAEIGSFHFQKGKSIMHQLDTRFKILLLLGYSFAIYNSSLPGLIILSLLIISLFFKIITKPHRVVIEMKGIFYIFLLIFLSTALSFKGDPIYKNFQFLSLQGIVKGATAGWRFLLIVVLGLLFTATTLPEQINRAVINFLKPVPFINEYDIAARLSLTIMFIPILLDILNEIKEARKSRYIEGSLNPIRKITTIAVPLVAAIIKKAEETTMALEARLFTGSNSQNKTAVLLTDYLILGFGIIPITASLLL